MGRYVYWNHDDHDCIKIFHFLSKDDKDATIIPLIEESEVGRIYGPSNYSTSDVLERIEKSDLVIFCTHGTRNTIMKYQKRDKYPDKDFVLIDEHNMGVLKGKNVIAFCCYSAKILGRKCVDNAICKAYVGFEGPIDYDTDNHVSAQEKHKIYVVYKTAFCEALKCGIEDNLSALDFKNYLLYRIRKGMVDAALNGQDREINTVYITAIKGLVALGNESEKIFSAP